MFEKAIQKLRKERAKLTRNAKEFDTRYKSEIRRINTAIENFEERVTVLGSKHSLPRGSATQEIENFLAENGANTPSRRDGRTTPKRTCNGITVGIMCPSNNREEKEKVQARIPVNIRPAAQKQKNRPDKCRSLNGGIYAKEQ